MIYAAESDIEGSPSEDPMASPRQAVYGHLPGPAQDVALSLYGWLKWRQRCGPAFVPSVGKALRRDFGYTEDATIAGNFTEVIGCRYAVMRGVILDLNNLIPALFTVSIYWAVEL